MDIIEGDEIFYCNEKECENDRVKQAKEKELNSWKENEVYTETEWKEGMKVINVRWIVTEKEKKGGKMCKARLVARGFLEKNENNMECEAPTCTNEGLKIVISTIKRNMWRVRSLDIKTAYLQPPKEAKTDKIWKLGKAVYSLKDAARSWYDSLMTILKATGGRKSTIDPTIMMWKEKDKLIGVMCVHVDDLRYGGNDEFNEKVINKIREKIKVGTEENSVFKYIGIDITDEGKEGVIMSQENYVKEKVRIPAVTNGKINRYLNKWEQKDYRSGLGQLNWLAQNTRPDLSYMVSYLGRNMKQATTKNFSELSRTKQKARERGGQVHIGCLKEEVEIEIYADASFGNVEGGKTQIGYYIGLKDKEGNICPIVWKSRVAKRVVSSILAAETFSVAEAVEWGEYIKHLWEELNNKDCDKKVKIAIKTDRKSLEEALKSTNGVKSRMVRIELASIKNRIEEGIIENIGWVNSKDQIADCLTKRNVSPENLMNVVGGIRGFERKI